MKNVHRKGPSLYYVKNNKWTWICRHDASDEEIHGAIWRLLTQGEHNLKAIMEDYMEVRLKDLAPATQADYERIIRKQLIPTFGKMHPDSVSSQDIAVFLERRERGGHGPIGNKERAVLSSVYNHGMRTGKARYNPTIGVRRNRERPRTFYVDNGSLRKGLRNTGPGLRHLMWAAYLTGFRQKDLTLLTEDNLTPEGIRIVQSKDGKYIEVAWSDSLRAVVRRAMKRSKCQYIFTNDHGQKLTRYGIQSAMRRMKAKAGVEWRFHDIRAKAESDHKTGLGLMSRYKRAKKLRAVK